MIIHGKYAMAICCARVIEDEAVAQIQAMYDSAFTEGCDIRVMPDVHVEKGCTIGCVSIGFSATLFFTTRIACHNNTGEHKQQHARSGKPTAHRGRNEPRDRINNERRGKLSDGPA